MYLVKTPEGQQAFKERHVDLSQRLRSAFLLFDGSRSLAQVLTATAATGVSKDDILALVTKGWLARREAPALAGEATVAVEAQPAKAVLPSLAPAKVEPGSTMRRYQQAYPMAVSITGGLGSRASGSIWRWKRPWAMSNWWSWPHVSAKRLATRLMGRCTGLCLGPRRNKHPAFT